MHSFPSPFAISWKCLQKKPTADKSMSQPQPICSYITLPSHNATVPGASVCCLDPRDINNEHTDLNPSSKMKRSDLYNINTTCLFTTDSVQSSGLKEPDHPVCYCLDKTSSRFSDSTSGALDCREAKVSARGPEAIKTQK